MGEINMNWGLKDEWSFTGSIKENGWAVLGRTGVYVKAGSKEEHLV